MSEYKDYRPEGRWRTGLADWIRHIPTKCREVIVQVGVSRGDATKIFSKHFRWVVDVDTWNDPGLFAAYLENIKECNNVITMRAHSLRAAELLRRGHFDAVYVDANHLAPHPLNDIRAYSGLIYDAGYIGGHDYNDENPGVKDAVNAEFGKPDKTFADDSWIVFKESQHGRL